MGQMPGCVGAKLLFRQSALWSKYAPEVVIHVWQAC